MTSTQTETFEAHELVQPVRLEEVARSNLDPAPASTASLTSARLDKAAYLKFISASFSFFCTGVNDGSLGALIPYIIRDYRVNTAIISSVWVLILHPS